MIDAPEARRLSRGKRRGDFGDLNASPVTIGIMGAAIAGRYSFTVPRLLSLSEIRDLVSRHFRVDELVGNRETLVSWGPLM